MCLLYFIVELLTIKRSESLEFLSFCKHTIRAILAAILKLIKSCYLLVDRFKSFYNIFFMVDRFKSFYNRFFMVDRFKSFYNRFFMVDRFKSFYNRFFMDVR